MGQQNNSFSGASIIKWLFKLMSEIYVFPVTFFLTDSTEQGTLYASLQQLIRLCANTTWFISTEQLRTNIPPPNQLSSRRFEGLKTEGVTTVQTVKPFEANNVCDFGL